MPALPRSASRSGPASSTRGRVAPKRFDDPVLDRAVPALADEFTAWLVTSLAMRLSRGASGFYTRNWGIGSTEYRLVMALGREGPCSAVRAAASADIDKAAASRSMQVLVRAGFVELVRQGRESECRLTRAGTRLRASLHEASLLRDGRLTRGFKPAEIERLRTDLRRLLDNVGYMNED